MVTYLEEKMYRAAHDKLLQHQLKVTYQFQRDEVAIELAKISEEEKNIYLDKAIDNYDRNMRVAEQEYDKAVNKIRAWKKTRQER